MTISEGSAFHHLPRRMWRKVRRLPIELVERWQYRNSMIPPKSMIFIGRGDFEQIGLEFRKYFIDLADLQPDDKVLDVGCGLERMAVPLTGYLSARGEYWGFDIVRKAVVWCTHHISNKAGNFHFQHSDVYNRHYNPDGKIDARRFRFPFPDARFDFVLLTSVFTHMLPPDLENYLHEISRVLKPGGKCLISFFLLNEKSQGLVRSGQATLAFTHAREGCVVADPGDPEAAIAYGEAAIMALFAKSALEVSRPIQYGSWCGRKTFLSYQDLIVATRLPEGPAHLQAGAACP